eukprot:scaffold79843_cov80-Phaeocystis_antarctica.AAC.3
MVGEVVGARGPSLGGPYGAAKAHCCVAVDESRRGLLAVCLSAKLSVCLCVSFIWRLILALGPKVGETVALPSNAQSVGRRPAGSPLAPPTVALLLRLPRPPLLSSSRFSTRAAKEPYAVLGLPQDASAEQVKRAYYQLALTLHPDRHPDSPDAVERFTEVGAAYTTILGDESLDTEERRKAKAAAGQPAEMPDEVAFTKVPPPKLTCNPACPGCNPTCPGRSPMCPGCSHMYSGAARRRLPELGGPAGELAAPPRRRAARRMADALLLAHHLSACAAAC